MEMHLVNVTIQAVDRNGNVVGEPIHARCMSNVTEDEFLNINNTPAYHPSNRIVWSVELDSDTSKLIKDFINSQQKKNNNLVRRLAARSIINASFHS